MFALKEYVIYGNNGVCKVESIGPVNMPGVEKTKIYYTLVPLYANGSKVYTPVENPRAVMRAVLSREEALSLIDRIPEIDLLWVSDEKKREQIYKEALHTCECIELIKIIKTLYLRKESRLAGGKKVTLVDEKYLRKAEDCLYGELAIPLKMEKNQVEDFVADRVKELEREE